MLSWLLGYRVPALRRPGSPITGPLQRAQVFKRWAAAAMAAHPELDVSTCHNYEISYAFRWACTNPGCARAQGFWLKPVYPNS